MKSFLRVKRTSGKPLWIQWHVARDGKGSLSLSKLHRCPSSYATVDDGGDSWTLRLWLEVARQALSGPSGADRPTRHPRITTNGGHD